MNILASVRECTIPFSRLPAPCVSPELMGLRPGAYPSLGRGRNLVWGAVI